MPADIAGSPLAGVPHEPGVDKPDPILAVQGMSKSFGGLLAVDVDKVSVQRGLITALIGPNGAGKTTFFNLLTGFDEVDSGTATFDGRDVSGMSPFRLANMGMVRTFQLTKSLTRLSVIENMKLGARDQRGESFLPAFIPFFWRDQEEDIEDRAEALLERFQLSHMRDEYAGTLSGGQRKLLEMARALMAEPRLVMLDEPMAGVNPALTQSLLEHVKGLRTQGITVVFVEHNMDVVRDISDWVVVMSEGRVIFEGPPDVISQDPAVIDAYLGAHHDAPLTEEQEEKQIASAEAELAESEGENT
ncbi:MAG TPA: ABC transporter ATP-binding protein [Acidimicrobiia bacterium]|nr:ABC transporter ATP-binding protein [Acidimicrobiia bacterium]